MATNLEEKNDEKIWHVIVWRWESAMLKVKPMKQRMWHMMNLLPWNITSLCPKTQSFSTAIWKFNFCKIFPRNIAITKKHFNCQVQTSSNKFSNSLKNVSPTTEAYSDFMDFKETYVAVWRAKHKSTLKIY